MAPGVPTELESGHQPSKTMRPTSDTDIEMTGVDDMMADHIQDIGKPADINGDLAKVSTSVHHATTINDEGLDEEIPDGGYANNNDTIPWNDTPGWGFDILNSSANSNAPDFREIAAETAVINPEDQPTISSNNEDNVAETANELNTTEDANAPGNEQAVRDAIAEDVAAEAAAADQANTQDWLAAQDRWLNQLANDNPEEFARLVESGVIDEDFIPQRLVQQDDGNNMTDANANTDETANHAATNVDGQVDDAIEEEEVDSSDRGNAWTNPVAPAQPTTDGSNNTAPGNPAPDTGNFVWLANRNDAREENTVCPACQTDFAPSDDIIYLDCGHAWCPECLNANYRSALKNRAQWPPRCCNIAIAHHSIAYLLEDELQMELAMKMDEFADRNPIFCQTPKCTGGYIAAERRDGQWASCQVCRLSTCVECKAPATAHPMPSMHPNMIAQLDKELADGQGWKQCPGCHNVVERIEGCNFMSCECGHHFCYQCGKTLENNMPCDCMGQHQWVADMNNEVAGVQGGDGEGDGDGADDENEDESESESESEAGAGEGDSESSFDDEDSEDSEDSEEGD